MVIPTLSHHFLKALYTLWNISIAAGLPNITGNADSGATKAEYNVFSGAFKASGNAKPNISGNSPWQYYGLGLDASLLNSVYGKSTTVTPLSTSTLYVIKY